MLLPLFRGYLLAASLFLVNAAPIEHNEASQNHARWTLGTADEQFFNASAERVRIERPPYFNRPNPREPAGPEKYFHEASFGSHYDDRFALRPMSSTSRSVDLSRIIASYFSVMDGLGVRTWIMHGTLMGWWWGGRIMPWDQDMDVMMTFHTLESLVPHNMSLFSMPDPATNMTHTYLLDINSRFANDSLADRLNVIDARWIDIETGLFVDITALRYDHVRAANGQPGWLTAKDNHAYPIGRIFPLRQSTFEDAAVRLPNAYPEILAEEYGIDSLTKDRFAGYSFNRETGRWEIVMYRSGQGRIMPQPARLGQPAPPHPEQSSEHLKSEEVPVSV